MITVATTEHPKTSGSRALRCRVLTDFGQLEALAQDWERLWSLDPGKEIFQHFGWIRAWMRAFGKDHRLFTPVVYDGEDVVAILPLVECKQQLRFIGYSTSDYNTLLSLPTLSAETLTLALETLCDSKPRRWKRAILDKVGEGTLFGQALAQLPDRWQHLIQTSRPTPCPRLILGDAKEQLLAGILSKDKVKKTCKTILRLGDLSFRHLDTKAEIREHMPRLAEQHISRCVLDGRQSSFLQADYGSFFSYLTEELDPGRQIRFSVLELSGKPVAYHLGFEVDGKYLFYKPTFDIDLWDYSPGQVLLFKLFESFRNSDVREFDMGEGPEPYKYRYANASRANLTFTVHSPGIAGQTMRACGQAVAAAQGRSRLAIDRHPKLQKLGNWIEGAAARWRRPGVLKRAAGSRVYSLPEAVDSRGGLELCPVTLRTLARQAAHEPDFLTAADLHGLRERLKKGHVVYVDKEWRFLLIAQRTGVVETTAGSIDLGGDGLVFTILREARNFHPDVIQSMAEIAKRQGLPGWLVSNRPEPGLILRTASHGSGEDR